MWSLKYTKADEEYLREKGAITGKEAKVENWFYWQAYNMLRGSRTGDGTGPIPFSEIAAYSDWVGIICPVMKFRFARFMVSLDSVERKHGNAQTKT